MSNKILHLALVTSLTMWACSDEKSTTGISIEPNTVADASSSSENFLISSSSETLILDSEQAFIDSVLMAFGAIQYSDDNIDDPEDTPSPTTMYTLPGERETLFYSRPNDRNGSCLIMTDREDNSIQKLKSLRPGNNNTFETILLRNKGEDLFLINLFYAGYGDQDVCESEISSYLEKSLVPDNQIRQINPGCTSTQIIYVKKDAPETTIDDIASIWIQECEEYISSLPEVDKTPGESCRMDQNGEITCE